VRKQNELLFNSQQDWAAGAWAEAPDALCHVEACTAIAHAVQQHDTAHILDIMLQWAAWAAEHRCNNANSKCDSEICKPK
jgi:hypothetical protein